MKTNEDQPTRKLNRYARIRHKPGQFWCYKCDRAIVESDRPESGDFFLQAGHGYVKDVGYTSDGDYVAVMFAVCKECQQ